MIYFSHAPPSDRRVGFFIAAFCFSICFFGDFLFAGNITGTVFDKNSNRTIVGVEISQNDSVIAYSDSSGRFSFQPSALPPVYLFSKPNYYQYSLFDTTGQNSNLTIYLNPVKYPLPKITVAGESTSTNSLNLPIEPLTVEINKIVNYSTTRQIAQNLPGISIKSYGGPAGVANISLAGGQGDRISVMIDGVQINNEQNGSADITQIPAALLSQIEFYPYGASARLGSAAMTGVVNFKPQTMGSKYSHSAGSYGLTENTIMLSQAINKFQTGFIVGRFNYDGNFSFTENGSYNSSQDGAEFENYKSEILQEYAYIWLESVLTDHNHLKITGLCVNNSRILSGFAYQLPSTSELSDDLILTNFNLKGKFYELSTYFKHSGMKYYKPPIGGPAIDSEYEINTVHNKIEFFWEDHSLKYEYKYVQNRNQNISNNNPVVIDTSKQFRSVSGEYQKYFADFQFVIAGRIEWEKKAAPVFAGELFIGKKYANILNELSFSISQNYKKPSFNDLFWQPFGDPNLKTETSQNIYLRTKFLFRQFAVNINPFYIKYINMIRWVPQAGASGLWRPENVQSAESFGYHLNCRYFWKSSFELIFNYDHNLTKNYDVSIGSEHYGKPIPYTPEHNFSARIFLYSNCFDSGISYQKISKRIRQYDYPKDLFMPDYGLVNLHIGKSLELNQLEISGKLIIENLFDEDYQSVYGYLEPGRSFIISFEIKKKESKS